MVTETQESCSCGCDCCDVGALDPEEKIARLRELREAADRRLVELGAG